MNFPTYLDRFDRWWATMPPDQRCALYRPQQLADAAGIPVRSLPLVAALAGWERATRWLIGTDGRRKHRTFFAPPGARVPDPAPRGRPPTSAWTILNRRPPSPFDVTEHQVLSTRDALPPNVIPLRTGAH